MQNQNVRTVQRAVPAHLRTLILLLVAVSALAVAVLTVTLYGSRGPGLFDRPVMAAVRSIWAEAGVVAYFIDGLAAPVPAVMIVAALVVGCLVAKRWRLAVVAAIGPLSAPAATVVVKRLAERTIHGDNLAFPSGHTAFATGVGLLLGLLLIGLFQLGRGVGGAMLLALTLVIGAGMAVNQVVLDAHYPTDTVGGFFTAIAVVLVAALVVDFLADLVLTHRRN